jgi:FPC/CPF motif-containing protein YcgG
VSDEKQLTLEDCLREVQEERARFEQKNRERRARRSFVVFATDPERAGQDDYKLVFACEART